jgi:hypothetical protein
MSRAGAFVGGAARAATLATMRYSPGASRRRPAFSMIMS